MHLRPQVLFILEFHSSWHPLLCLSGPGPWEPPCLGLQVASRNLLSRTSCHPQITGFQDGLLMFCSAPGLGAGGNLECVTCFLSCCPVLLGDVLFQMAEVHRQIQNQLEEMVSPVLAL